MSVALSSLDAGEGPPLLILHGLFGSARNWNTVARRLATTHRVHALDLRNHGNSPWADTMGYPEMAADVRRFMALHGLERAVVLGHSMGGKTAMALALEHGDLVERLIVVDIAPVTYAHSHLSLIQAMRRVDLTVGRRAEVEAQLAEGVPDPGLRAFLLQNLVPEGRGFRWRINLAGIAAAMDDLTGFPADLADRRYSGKTLFLTGARSDYVRDEHRDAILGLFPQARIEIVPEAGHWIHAEQPERVVDSVTRFLRDEVA